MRSVVSEDKTPQHDELVLSAAAKIEAGALLKLSEVAAALDVTPSTVHRLPLPSIRIGKSLRFDPQDVRRFIESSKEAAIV